MSETELSPSGAEDHAGRRISVTVSGTVRSEHFKSQSRSGGLLALHGCSKTSVPQAYVVSLQCVQCAEPPPQI